MKKSGFLITGLIFLIGGITLFILQQFQIATIAAAFGIVMLFSFFTLAIMELQNKKKLDKKYYVLKKEHLIKEYDKLKQEILKERLLNLCLVYIEFKQEYSLNLLKRFGIWLTKKYNVDPSGYDEGIIVLFVNIHEVLIPELMKQMKKEIKEQEINLEFKYGFAVLTSDKDYKSLKAEAQNNLK